MRAIKRSAALVALLSAVVVQAQPNSPVPSPPAIAAESHILLDLRSARILSENNADARVEPASITKIMSAYVVFEHLDSGNISLTDEVTISERAWRMEGSRMFVEVGTQVGLEELLRGMIVQSGNDASVALAEYVAGSETAFVDLMNFRAGELGMDGTHYTNVTGLPDAEHYTTARDTAALSAALIGHFPERYRYFAEREFTYNEIRQSNRNDLLWRDLGVDGLKTGHTEAAGYCLAASAERGDMRLVSVVMGADSEQARANQSAALLNYGFRFFESVQPYAGGEQITTARVWRGRAAQVPLVLETALHLTIPRGRYSDLEANTSIRLPLSAPIEAGEPLGHLSVTLDSEELVRRPLLAGESVARANFVKRWWHGLRLWVKGVL